MASLPPVCLAMLICDGIYVDRVSGKVSILGTFEEFRTNRVPFRLPPLVVYCELSGGRGRTALSLDFVRELPGSSSRLVVARSVLEVDFADPKRIVRVQFPFGSMELLEPGEYCCTLEAEGSCVAERSLVAIG